MAAVTSPNSPKAFALDVTGFPPTDIVPDALILGTSTKAGVVEGDEPAVRVPYVDLTDDAGFIAEGAVITEADPDKSEVVINTGKVAVLVRVSREVMAQGRGVSGMFTDSIRRAIIAKANVAYLAQVAPTSPAVTPPAGLLNQSPTAGGAIADSLDVLVDAVMSIEAAGGSASHIIAAPDAFASLATLKTATGSNQSLVGAGVEAAERRLLGVPVLVSSAMTAGSLLVVDKGAVLSAYGAIQLATSTDAYFSSDSVGIRATWRFGQRIVDPSRVVSLTVTAGA